METLENVSRTGKWSGSVETLNSNFIKLEDALTDLGFDIKKCKGLFPSVDDLKTKFPRTKSKSGDWAYIGTSSPATLYIWTGIEQNEGWENTGLVDSLRDSSGEEIDLTEYAKSVETTVADITTFRNSWIYSNNYTTWADCSNGEIKINSSSAFDPVYTISLRSLLYGISGEQVNYNSQIHAGVFVDNARLISVKITSSDGIVDEYRPEEETLLHWAIDKYYYVQEESGEQRNPEVGDEFNLILDFESNTGILGTLNYQFKFIS